MARCGCSNQCNCILVAGDCTAVAGNGDTGTPYTVSTLIDSTEDNQVSCADGLYVPPASVEVGDTNCIALSGTGFPGDPILANPTIDPDASNLLACTVDGLLSSIVTVDIPCFQLSGDGTAVDPLSGEAIVSPTVGNQLSCTGNGLFVDPVQTQTIEFAGRIGLGAAYSTPAGVGVVVLAKFPFDTVYSDVGGVTDIALNQLKVPVGGAGWYFIGLDMQEFGSGLDCFETTAAFYQLTTSINTTGATNNGTVAKCIVGLLGDENVSYSMSAVEWLDEGDAVYHQWAVSESTNLLAIVQRPYHVTLYPDGNPRCALYMVRVGI